jgi:hypothetical protein
MKRRPGTERKGSHDDPRSTDAALGTTMFDKRPLQRMTPVKGFNCRDLRTKDVCKRHQARVHCYTIDKHRARAAFTFTTSFFGSRQPAIFTQDVQQPLHGVRIDSPALAVYRQVHFRSLVTNEQRS